MRRSISKYVLLLVVPALLALIVVNAVTTFRTLGAVRDNTRQRQESTALQASIDAARTDIEKMETGQWGYLITGEDSYLKPYTDAKARLSDDFAALTARLETRSDDERALAKRVQELAAAKIQEVEGTVKLREHDYRKRAFREVASNRGKDASDEALTKLEQLSAAAASHASSYDDALATTLQRARKATILATIGLFLGTALVYWLSRIYSRRLEQDLGQATAALEDVNVRLEAVTSTISRDMRQLLGGMKGSAEALLQTYGDFLPNQGLEHAQRIQGAAGETSHLIEELLAEKSVGHVA